MEVEYYGQMLLLGLRGPTAVLGGLCNLREFEEFASSVQNASHAQLSNCPNRDFTALSFTLFKYNSTFCKPDTPTLLFIF